MIGQQGRGAALVLGVKTGIDIADRDCFDAFVDKTFSRSENFVVDQRPDDVTVGAQVRSNMVGVRMRPISRISRKPAVVISPVFAPAF